ncbi:Prefoldin [Corynascus novoguineensis]|uniref:Prefoldin n=1 Tax=Corynascus novoguineensis TaxID=1126955 RepID=A0AAN7CSI7_9PEZI|nr:Prefoldin [Corynascus novoguineensis]
MADIQAKLQALSEEYTKLQQDLQETVQSRQKLEAQKQENLGVQKVEFFDPSTCILTDTYQEFAKLKDEETIYKLIGPVLLKQERVEAESTVKGRLEFIEKEISRLESHIKEMQGKMDKKKGEIIQVQTSAQAAAPQAAKA